MLKSHGVDGPDPVDDVDVVLDHATAIADIVDEIIREGRVGSGGGGKDGDR